jgi:hypothetical protein
MACIMLIHKLILLIYLVTKERQGKSEIAILNLQMSFILEM